MRRSHARAGVLLLTACTPVSEQTAADTRELAREVRARVGHELAAWSLGDTVVSEAVRGLLADELTEASAVKIALLNNRAVQASYERLGLARADLVQAGLLANPVFDANAKFFSGGTEVELALVQPLLDIFLRPRRERVAEHEFAAARAAVTRDLVHLAFNVRREFVEVRTSQRVIALQRQICDVARASHELMAKLHAAGNVTDPEVTAARASYARARLDLAAAEQAAREAREPLHVLLGVWGADVEWRVADAVAEALEPATPLDHVEARCVAASLDLAENRAHIDAAAQRSGVVAWEGLLPDTGLGVAAKREAGDGWGLGPALAFDVPLFDAGGARVAGAQAVLRQTLHRHVQIAVEVRSAARLLRDRHNVARDRVAFMAGELLPMRARFVRETQQNYNAMQIGAFDVLAARRLEIAAGREHLEAVRDAWLAALDLEELLAGSINRTTLAPRAPQVMMDDEAPARGH